MKPFLLMIAWSFIGVSLLMLLEANGATPGEVWAASAGLSYACLFGFYYSVAFVEGR